MCPASVFSSRGAHLAGIHDAMDSHSDHERAIRGFFEGFTTGGFPDDLFAANLLVWTTAGEMSGDHYRLMPKVVKSIFPEGLAFTIDALVLGTDRAAAEVRSEGLQPDGPPYRNRYAFIFGFEGGRISSIAEHFNPLLVPRDLAERMMAALQRCLGGG